MVKYPRKLEFSKVEFLRQYSEKTFCTKSSLSSNLIICRL